MSKNLQCAIDVMGHQRRWEQEGEALAKFLEATEHIKSMDEELNRQSNQLRDQTDQLKIHNDTIKKINEQVEQESNERKKSDRSNRWFSVGMAFLAFALGLIADHISEIIEWAKSL